MAGILNRAKSAIEANPVAAAGIGLGLYFGGHIGKEYGAPVAGAAGSLAGLMAGEQLIRRSLNTGNPYAVIGATVAGAMAPVVGARMAARTFGHPREDTHKLASWEAGVADGIEKVAIFKEIDEELHDPRLYSNVRGAFESREDRVKAHKKLTKGTAPTRRQAVSEGWNRRKRAAMEKEAAMYEQGGNLHDEIGPGVTFVIPKGKKADEYKKKRGFVGSTAPRSKDDNSTIAVGKSMSRALDKRNPNRPRYASLKDMILRRPDPRYKPGVEKI